MFPRWQWLRSFCALVLLWAAVDRVSARVIATSPGQPAGALSGRIVFTSAGHGWTYNNSAGVWYTQRGDNNDVVEDYGNLDQMNLFVSYCFNAGATVVAFRPIGYQTNEVVLDNISPSVRFVGSWTTSTAVNNFYGRTGDVPYRFASIGPAETATAIYTPTIPAAGFYPVYTWASHGGNRTSQLYLINHTGGQGKVRVPHHMVGNGWVYLGTYYFNAGSNALTGSVVISNLQPAPLVGSVVIADAIRFGNGLGDVVPVGGGTPRVSGYPREEECARYWIQRMLGVGAPASIYDVGSLNDGDDNVGAPPRMAREMNRSEAGSMFNRVFLSFHSNAGGGNGRGCEGLYNNESLFPGTATPNQFRLAELIATELNVDLAAQTSPPLEVPWVTRPNPTYARADFPFGEINNNAINDEFDATIIEVAYHDNVDDARLLRDPRARILMARASYQGIVRYMNEFDAAPLVFAPEAPTNVRAAANNSGGIVVSWSLPGSGGGPAAGYVVYRSTNGYGFGNPIGQAGGGAGSLTIDGLAPDQPWYFRVCATNAGGESMPSETAGCQRSSRGDLPVLIVNGFDRFDRTLAVRQTAGPGIGGASGGTATFDRIQPRLINSFDYVVQHGTAISRCGVPFDSCQNEAILSGQVRLTDYAAVVWALGEESTADETFSSAEQNRVINYLNLGGRLLVSGSEIAWDLDRATGPTASDRSFLRNHLHASLGSDANDDSGTASFVSAGNGIFAGNAGGVFDGGANLVYSVDFPDVLTPSGSNALPALSYSGGLTGAAAIQNIDPVSGSRMIFMGFPFETILSPTVREACMFDILSFFGVIRAPLLATPSIRQPDGFVVLSWEAIRGRKYQVQFRSALSDPFWNNFGPVILATSDLASYVDAGRVSGGGRFYRVVMVD